MPVLRVFDVCLLLMALVLSNSLFIVTCSDPSPDSEPAINETEIPFPVDSWPITTPMPKSVADEDEAFVGGSAPKLLLAPADIYATLGSTVVLGCIANGKPEPRVAWFKNGRQIIPFPFYSLLRIRPALRSLHLYVPAFGSEYFDDVSSKPSYSDDFVSEGPGQSAIKAEVMSVKATTVNAAGSLVLIAIDQSMLGEYSCLATNAFGEAESSPAIVSSAWIGEEFRVSPPKFVVAETGKSVSIGCVPPMGEPMPTIRWKKGKDSISTKDNRIVNSQDALTINSIEDEDYDFYYCIAESPVGTRLASTQLLSVHFIDTLLQDCRVVVMEERPPTAGAYIKLDAWMIGVLLAVGTFAIGVVIFAAIVLLSGSRVWHRRRVFSRIGNVRSFIAQADSVAENNIVSQKKPNNV